MATNNIEERNCTSSRTCEYKNKNLDYNLSFAFKMLPFQHPCTIMVSGPSKSGKTTFINKLLQFKDQMFSTKFKEIVWCYGAVVPYLSVENVRFHEGIPSLETFEIQPNSLIILDDLMSETNVVINDLFIKHSHHKSLTVIFIVQNLFPKGKHSRNISLNSHYLVVFKNPRDKLQIEYLARQIMPRDSKALVGVFEQATVNPHSYLLFDLTQSIPEALRIRTNIFPDETMHIYAHVKDLHKPVTFSSRQDVELKALQK